MVHKFSIVTLALVACTAIVCNLNSVQATSDPKTVCYYESWVHWRTGEGKMDPKDIDVSLCSHVVYTYFGIDAGSHEIKLLDAYLMKDLHDLQHFVEAVHKNTSAKALIAIGGSSMSDQFSITAGSDFYRETFVKSVVNFVASYKFDGFMIDWYGVQEKDSDNLIKLLDKFDEHLASTPYTMGITLPATIATLDYYNVPKINEYVDFINVLSLDYAGSWSKTVNHASPLPEQLTTLEQYHKRGAPRAKLIMAVPLYARTWRLVSPEHQSVGDEATGGGEKGPYTQVEGLLSYNELCVMIKGSPNAFSIVRDMENTAVTAVYLHGSSAEFISFEDTKTLASKAKNITEEGYGGVSVYSLSNEDVHGLCGAKYPLLHAIVENYYRGAVTEKIVPTIVPTRPTTEQVTDVPGVFKCHSVGKYRDPTYCFKYYDCEKGDFGLETTVMFCEHDQAFDEKTSKCVPRKEIKGC